MLVELETGLLVEPIRGVRWGREEISQEVAVRIGRFKNAGISRGDRIFILFGNSPEFFAELLAIWKVGGCAIPIDSRLTGFELQNLLQTASPRAAIVDEITSPEIVRILEDSKVPMFLTKEVPRDGSWANEVHLDDEALILFTSGSTGNPKGVVHTHRSLRARWISLKENLGVRSFRRTLCMLPTHFGHGLICNCLFPWLSGQDLFVTPPFRHDLVMRLGFLVDENHITFLSSVPAMWRLALKLARPPARGTLERVHCGSAPLSAHMWNQIREWSGTRNVCNAYGITETGSWVAGLTDTDVEAQDGLIGPGWGAKVEVARTRETRGGLRGKDRCEVGEEGFVWLNTPALMKGYLGRDDLTRESVVDGWFFTGDIGFLDERGYLVLKGRVRDEINKGGMKIFPSDIDSVVERFPATVDVCTFALDDPLYGQNVGMAVVLSDKEQRTIKELYDWMRAHVSEAKIPVRWWILDSIPRTSRGKVNREEVKATCQGLKPLDLGAILSGKEGKDGR